MLRTSVILMMVTAGVLADEDPCSRFFDRGLAKKCCMKEVPVVASDETKEALKECGVLPKGPRSCDRELCVASKLGYTTADGKNLDMAKIKETILSNADKFGPVSNDIIKYCIDGDLSKFGPADVCDAVKLRKCIELQFTKQCPEWSNDGPCAGLQDLSVVCKKKYN